ncbi:MAG: polyisoprenoid-binding protein [Gammaproteobacteria bacterium HGW-Gammaproteobacteria-4]|nr:MAG: polyisoprenoid-binding protein [Gammaproteobacteria bacterium HGW-Gammaproteobacteria-4]
MVVLDSGCGRCAACRGCAEASFCRSRRGVDAHVAVVPNEEGRDMIRIALFALLLPLSGIAADYHMDAAQSHLGFVGTVQGERFEGRFAAFTADIRFDPDALAESRFDVRIDLASADSRNEERDSALKGEDFFAVERLPQAHYHAERFRRLDDGRFVADGELTLRGITRPVSLGFRCGPMRTPSPMPCAWLPAYA